MSTLQEELNRLYDAPGPMAPDGGTRALVLELARPADWEVLSTLWRGVQTDLALPAPAIAVNGVDGYQLWFSLAEPVPVATAHAFLDALRGHYLNTVAPGRIGMMPVAGTVPARQLQTGLWSAFVAPDLASIFAAEPWLDLPPSPEAQAQVLSRLECIKPAAWAAVVAQLLPVAGAFRREPEPHAVAGPAPCSEPQQFLLSVMNDPAVEMHLRIEAAKALLPWSGGGHGGKSG